MIIRCTTLHITYTCIQQTMLVPVAEALLDWNETIISIFFSAAGAEVSIT